MRDGHPPILRLVGGPNLYVYGNSSPLVLTDPSGEIIPLLLIALVAGFGIGAGATYIASGGEASTEDVLIGGAIGSTVAVAGVIIILTTGGTGSGLLLATAQATGTGAVYTFNVAAATAATKGLVVGATVCMTVATAAAGISAACHAQYEACVATKLNSRRYKGSVWGESRCMTCRDRCIANGGIWPNYWFFGSRRYSCRYWLRSYQ